MGRTAGAAEAGGKLLRRVTVAWMRAVPHRLDRGADGGEDDAVDEGADEVEGEGAVCDALRPFESDR